jgi:Nucleotidyltransferase domain.
MRLTSFEIETIKESAFRIFGTQIELYLFGSRTKDLERGGDIDLCIKNESDKPLSVRSKIRFIADLVVRLGDQKVDVVLDNNKRNDSSFIQTIYKTGIRL